MVKNADDESGWTRSFLLNSKIIRIKTKNDDDHWSWWSYYYWQLQSTNWPASLGVLDIDAVDTCLLFISSNGLFFIPISIFIGIIFLSPPFHYETASVFSICIQDIHWILSNANKTASSSQIWKENTCSSSFALWPEVKIVLSFNTLHYHCNHIAPPVVHHHYHDFAFSKYRQSHGMACYTLNPNKINLATINSIRQFRIWKMWKFWTLDKYIFSLRQIPFVNWTECFLLAPP